MAPEGPKVESLAAKTLALALDYHHSDAIVTRFANQVTVSVEENGFYISFYEALPPLLIGPPEEVESRLSDIKTVRAECVARLYVPKAVLPGIIEAMQSVSGIHERIADANKTETSGAGK